MSRKEIAKRAGEARRDAKRSCRRCYGTGIMGARVTGPNDRDLLQCPCVAKERRKKTDARRKANDTLSLK